MTKIQVINDQLKAELSDEGTQRALLATTFKGLDLTNMKRALLEGMMRGFEFKDFLEKNVYAIPFRDGYSLVTSIDYARKVGMRSGIVGTSNPVWEEKDGEIISCSVTVMKKTGEYIGDYTATVHFNEYYSGKDSGRSKPTLWDTKPYTMIAKVAEMHALRKACPEELAQAYAEEEMHKEVLPAPVQAVNVEEYKAKLEAVTSPEELKKVWSSLPIEVKNTLKEVKDDLKQKFAVPVTTKA